MRSRQALRHLPRLLVIHRQATSDDCARLAELNHQLIHDEGHRNPMTVPELEQRMRGWLASDYAAVIFEGEGEVVAYALYREQPAEVYLRQLFVVRHRRRQGFGRRAFEILRSQIWPANRRLTVEVLVQNTAAVAFWRAVGNAPAAFTKSSPVLAFWQMCARSDACSSCMFMSM